jgi:hypothetical protein
VSDIFVDAPAEPGQRYAPQWGRLLQRSLFVIAFLVLAATPVGALSPRLCMDEGMAHNARDWHRVDTTRWPPGQRCVLTLEDGRTTTIGEHSWLPVVAGGLAVLATTTAVVRRRQRVSGTRARRPAW